MFHPQIERGRQAILRISHDDGNPFPRGVEKFTGDHPSRILIKITALGDGHFSSSLATSFCCSCRVVGEGTENDSASVAISFLSGDF